MRFLVSLLVISFLPLSCGTNKSVSNNSSGVNVLDFGAKPNDGRDDSRAFQRALNFVNEVGREERIIIPSGKYHIDRPVRLHNMMSDIFISGENGVEIIIRNSDFLSIWPEPTVMNLSADGSRHDLSVKLKNTGRLKAGDVLHIYSNSPWEEAWGFTENDIHIVKTISGSEVGVEQPLLFNYQPGKELVKVESYRSHSLGLENLKLTMVKRKSAKQRFSAITARAVILELHRIKIYDDSGLQPFHVGVNISRCPKVSFSNMEFYNLEYGLLMNYCRDIQGRKIIAQNCRHGIVPTNACVNVEIVDLEGRSCQGVMDAHMSFNVKYDSVKDIRATQFSNCRALGVIVSNSSFDVIPGYEQNFSYWSAQGLTQEYKGLYDEYDVHLDNVSWLHEHPTEFNGLAVYSCRDFFISNCTTHNLSLYGKLSGRAYIETSNLGNVRINSHAVTLKDCVMDGGLNTTTKYVLRLTGKGETVLDGVTVRNYDAQSTYLFNNFYNTSDYNKVTIKNSNIQELKAWTDAMTYPGLMYNGLHIETSRIEKFVEDWPENISID